MPQSLGFSKTLLRITGEKDCYAQVGEANHQPKTEGRKKQMNRKTSNKGGKILARTKTITDREDGHVSKKNQREGNYRSVRKDCWQSLKTMWLKQLFRRAN